MMYVLTGGPNSGKTSVINNLKASGWPALEEIARKVIKEREHIPLEEKEFLERQRIIFKKQLAQENEIESQYNISFSDRGLPDVLAYCQVRLGYMPWDIKNRGVSLTKRYADIFILDRMPFVQDGGRLEKSDEEAQKIHETIIQVYKQLGYKPIMVPLFDIGKRAIEERASFILDYVEILSNRNISKLFADNIKLKGGENNGRMLRLL